MSRRSRLDIVVNAQTRGAMTGLRNVMGSVGQLAKRITQVGAVAFAAMATAAVMAFRKMARSAHEYITELGNAREVTGMTVNQLAQISYAAQQQYGSGEQMRRGLQMLNRSIGEAATQGGRYEQALKMVGATQEEIASGNIQKILFRTVEWMHKTENASMKAAVAQQLMGRAGQQLIPALSMGTEAMNELFNEAKDAGIAGDYVDELADSAKMLGDQLDLLKARLQGMSLRFYAEIVDPITQVIEKLNEFDYQAFGKRMGLALRGTFEWIQKLLDPAQRAEAMKELGDFWETAKTKIVEAGQIAGAFMQRAIVEGTRDARADLVPDRVQKLIEDFGARGVRDQTHGDPKYGPMYQPEREVERNTKDTASELRNLNSFLQTNGFIARTV